MGNNKAWLEQMKFMLKKLELDESVYLEAISFDIREKEVTICLLPNTNLLDTVKALAKEYLDMGSILSENHKIIKSIKVREGK